MGKPGDPFVCLPVLPSSAVTMSGHMKQPQPPKDVITNGSDIFRIKVWVKSPGKSLKPA